MNTEASQPFDVYNATLTELEQLLHTWQQPPFRARQLYRQLYVNWIDDLAQATDLPAALRERLAQETRLGSLELVHVQHADAGMTRKALFKLDNGAVVETVLMVYPERATVCISTQAGCAMGCVFCATGTLGLLKNLSTGEIVAQMLWASREVRQINPQISITNLVFMGMGEPFANYDRWWAAVERLHDPHGFNFGARRMTVSTVGLVPGIRRLAAASLPINLAISLHAPNDALRSELMPINTRYPIAELLAATRAYISRTRRRVSFEYVLLNERNDTPELAAELATLLRGSRTQAPLLCHVNLIPWNPFPGTPLNRSLRKRVLAFQQVLTDAGIACTVRVERGVEIAAACGQLAGHTHLKPTAAPASLEIV